MSSGLVAVNAEAIGRDLTEKGRVVLDGIQFEFDKARLKAESKTALEAIAQYLKANPTKGFFVVGHTDGVGRFAYNQQLSADRAKAVVEALTTNYGVAAGRLEAHGVGPLVPVFSNGSDAGRDRNRRVELVERPLDPPPELSDGGSSPRLDPARHCGRRSVRGRAPRS